MLKLFIHRKWIKTAASLTSVMGLTWITGVLVFHEALILVAYIFTIFVAFEVTKVACTHIVMHGCNNYYYGVLYGYCCTCVVIWFTVIFEIPLLYFLDCCRVLPYLSCLWWSPSRYGIYRACVTIIVPYAWPSRHMHMYRVWCVGEGGIACVCERPSK